VIVAAPTTLLERARRLVASGRRRILGIVGPPGGGKSTVARLVVAQLGDAAALVPMDGFHLAQAELVRLGRRDRMGAPDTFDADGYVALMRRLRDATDSVVYAPEFRREIEEPIAGAIAIPRSVPLVVTEGNYLLLDRPCWQDVRPLLDDVWYVDAPLELLRTRLIARQIAHGRAEAEATQHIDSSDMPNARLVAGTKDQASRRIHTG